MSVSIILAFAVLVSGTTPSPQVMEQRVKVHVAGYVRRPGLYALPIGSRVADALQAAGGLTKDAAIGDMALADTLEDGQTVRVPDNSKPQGVAGSIRAGLGGLRQSLRRPRATESISRRINLNRASAGDLDRLPGIGPGLAARILAYRAKTGGFQSVEELREVGGIGEKRLARLAPLLEIR